MMESIGSPVTTGRAHRGSGGDDAVAVTMGKEHAEWGFEGQANFNDAPYLLAGHYGAAESASGGVFTFRPKTFDPDTLQTFGIVQGNDETGRAKKGIYGFCRDFRLRATLAEVTMSGQFQSRAIAYGQNLPNYDSLPAIPLGEADWQMYLGSAMDGSDLTPYGSTEGVLEYEFNSTGRLKGQNFADGTKTFADAVRTTSEKTVSLVMEDNSVAATQMANLRTGHIGLVRFRCPGPAISSSVNYLLQITTPYQFVGRRDANQDDLVGASYTIKPIWHPDYLSAGGSLEIVVTTELSGL